MQNKKIDYWLVFIYFFLISLSILLIYSTTYNFSVLKNKDPYFFFKRHLAGIGLSIFSLVFFIFVPLEKIRKKLPFFMIGIIIALILTFFPVLGKEAGGASRWLNLGVFSFQPSEIAKLIIVIYLASVLERNQEYLKTYYKATLAPLMMCFIISGIILFQKDFSTTSFLVLLTFIILYTAGSKFIYLLLSFLSTLPILLPFVFTSGYRMERVKMLIGFDENPHLSYQLFQSVEAFKRGGAFGTGLGKGVKNIPYIFNDFIFSAVGEEIGLIGSLIILFLFLFLWQRGNLIARQYPEKSFQSVLAYGITILLIFQMLMNVGVSLALIFPTGITLPFLSYGRTSLIVSSIGIGILLNLSRGKNIQKGLSI
ncbi:MAG: hypothetical protein A2Y41_05285 [Spirochaetes bacterium GWB1_36_13]|nr:MAG: hypothetical protein A2Y41_05285 [Spirochaetes bacterium GWB1_36_13]